MITTANYIPNATSWRDQRGESNYRTPRNGIHLCGISDDGGEPVTIALYPMHPVMARRTFDRAKADYACDANDADWIVDLCMDFDIVDDFPTTRQLWDRFIAAEQLANEGDRHHG